MTSSIVDSFQQILILDAFPPEMQDIQTRLQAVLPLGSEILQWAVVKADPNTQTVWVEGCYIVHAAQPV